MLDNKNIFKTLSVIIGLLVAGVVGINILYIKTACLSKNCVFVGILTIIFLLWATAFWLVVLKYSKKNGR